ncbi:MULTISPECIES: colanic acid biosynthesis protein WcaM [Atlantibacter]|uniref:colanic acid biosynthesis protein WcaM n=1 Tax=Atlantibacter TaxID=1903434 RepID=UPI0011CE4BF6|nr:MULTISPECIES: colanic acid biosynthesis protein WcaM [Atlantibacter]WIF56957.1 colanic acid biosynthesis protein WcaM [Atlantibacter hermannii]
MRNEKTLSRRTLLKAAGTAALLPLLHSPAARALESGRTVNIKDFYTTDWPDAFRRALEAAQTVEVPENVVCDRLNSAIFMPPGKTLRVHGRLEGNGKGRFVLGDNCTVSGGSQGSVHDVILDIRGSDCKVEDLEMSGFGPVALIFIGRRAPESMRNLTLDRLRIHDANYGILRQGFRNRIEGVRITNGDFRRLQGDAIEWNVAINDKDLLISDHVIEDINCTNGKTNWGIGIGLAGSTYDNAYPDSQAVKHFVVANITGKNCRQLVHVENGKHFIIRNISAHNITPEFSRKAGIDNATVAIYGCDDFSIDNVSMTNSAGMLIGYGVVKGKYLSIPQNFRLNNVRLDNRRSTMKLRGIQISSGNATSFVSLTKLDLQAASLEVHNKPQHLFMRDINIMQDASHGPALKLHFDLRKDVRGRFMARDETLLSLRNIKAVNNEGKSSVDIDRIDHEYIHASALNFRLPEQSK